MSSTSVESTSPRHAFYFRQSGEKKWNLIGVYDSAEEAWTASLELNGPGDLWFPLVPRGEVAPPLLSQARFRYRGLRVVRAK